MLLKNNPPPELGMHSSFYLKHFMNLLTESSNGAIPISKVYSYCDRWSINDWELFSEIILSSYDHFRSEMNDVMQQEADKGKK